MRINPYLNFNGTCAEAFRFYEQVLGGKITFMQTHGESPMRDQTPPDWHDAVMHVTLEVDGQMLMGSDAPGEYYEKPQGFSVSVHPEDAEGAERIFNALAEGGQVRMPLEKTFWAARFGMLVDRYGTPWIINCEKGD
ncbi:MAG TPA: VOC family protein [Longimicrobium sp.]|jgi:PhnB protein|nr:VOC family protein [Longimicrobium sp.]